MSTSSTWKDPTFLEDAKTHFKSIKFDRCRFWYILFLVTFIASIGLVARLQTFLPGKLEPTSVEVTLCIRMVNIACNTLIVLCPIAFLYIYYKIPQKHFSMIIWAMFGMCFCFSLSGITNALTWMNMDKTLRTESFIHYESAQYIVHKKMSLFLSSTEVSKNCCGVNNFMDYPAEIMSEDRAPDRCCIDFMKGCGRNLFVNTPLSYARRRDFPRDHGGSCLDIDSKLTIASLNFLITLNKTAAGDNATEILNDEFLNAPQYNHSFLCDDITLANYLDPICITSLGTANRFFAYKYQWCHLVFYNDSKEYGTFINNKLNVFQSQGCYKHLEDYADKVVSYSLIATICTTILSLILVVVYFKLYEDYRKEQLTIYPLPMWLEKFPGETQDTLPRGFGRRCHVHNFLALTDEREAELYMEKHPNAKRETLARIKLRNSLFTPPPESVPASILKTSRHAAQLYEDDAEEAPNYSVDATGTEDSVVDVFKKSDKSAKKPKRKDN